MRIAYISAGAAGMYCGSCLHDNTLAAALQRQGHDTALIPLYTPMRTDERSVSIDRVFFGAVNVYLEIRTPWLSRLLRPAGRLLDRPGVLNWVSRFAASSSARDLGAMTLGVLQGEDGPARQELETLVAWLREDLRPEVVHLQSSMFLGLARRIREELGVPVVCSLQGEEIFLDDLIEPYKGRVFDELRRRVGDADAFVATGEYYAGFMADYLHVPRERIHVVRLGLNLEGFEPRHEREDGEVVIGYLARICPEKGLHLLVDAFGRLARQSGGDRLRLRVAGYVGGRDAAYYRRLQEQVASWGLAERVDFLGEVDRAAKLEFFRGLDLLSVPAVYKEPKGLSVLEAMACGVPVVLPAHGSFPEMVEHTGGGLLVEPGSAEALAAGLEELITDDARRRRLGEAARQVVHRDLDADTMAGATVAVYERLLA